MWLNKYKPKNLNDFVGNRKHIYSLKKNHSNPVCIIGYTGIGKTLLAELFLKENNYEVHTFSAYEEQNYNLFKKKIEDLLNFQSILEIMRNIKIGIILKDVDNILVDIIKIISNASIKRKIFIVSNSNIKKTIKANKNISVIELEKATLKEIENFILKITLDHKFYLDNEGIDILYKKSNGDIRFIVKFLEELYFSKIMNETNQNFVTVDNKLIIQQINYSNKDIDYKLKELVNNLLFNKNTIDQTLLYVHYDMYFLPTIVYDNLFHLLESKDGLKYYYKCLKNIIISEYLNIKEFEHQTTISNDIQIILNSHIPNIYLTKVKKDKEIKYSNLMNRLLKYNNIKKMYIEIEHNIPKMIKLNHFNSIINFYKYMNVKRFYEYIPKIELLFSKYNIDIKLIKKIYKIK